MSETMDQGLWYKMCHTPMRDALRGRMTARLDIKSRINSSPIPAPAKDLIARVVKDTRLWRLEQVEVANELIAHFADGIEAGTPMERLIADFGDEKRSAKLIRRAMRRNRPIAWHLLRAIGWIIVSLIVLYGALTIYYFAGHPAPKVNYVALLNRPIESAPVANRAWPIYRQALIRFPATMPDVVEEARPGSKHWPEALQWARSHQGELDLLREAAAKPVLGFVLGPEGSAYDRELWPDRQAPPPDVDQTAGQDLISVLLPDLNMLRQFGNMLEVDARSAQQGHDTARLLADIDAMEGLAQQTREGGFLISDLVSIGIRQRAIRQIERTLADAPAMLNDQQWIAMAHRIARPRVAGDLLSLDGERAAFADFVQRAFTDDGHGDGRFTPRGLSFLTWIGTNNAWQHSLRPKTPADPATALLVESRKQTIAQYDRLMSMAMANFGRPMREADWSPFYGQTQTWQKSILDSVRHLPLMIMVPAVGHTQAAAERYLGHRDGVVTGIALELYRRHHNRYPEKLEALVPEYFPQVPADRITGEEVHYRIVEGHPLIYSLGMDRVDDAGRPPLNGGGEPEADDAARWDVADGARVVKGDWVLFPVPDEKPCDCED